ncbi:MAG: FHIPEP family type III secretion protein [Armatimonadota bacterium]
MAKEKKKSASFLSKADIVIISGKDFGVALEHSGDETPVVLKKAVKNEFEGLLFEAESLGIPVVENSTFTRGMLAKLKEGNPIPKDFYVPAAQSLAFIYKSKSSPKQIKFVNILPLAKKLETDYKKLTSDMLKSLEIDTVRVEAGQEIFNRKKLLEESFLNLRQKIALDLGLALPPFKLELNTSLGSWQYNIFIKEVLASKGEIEKGISGEENILTIKNKLGQILYSNASGLLSYTDVYNLVLNLKQTNEALVNELFPRYLSVASLRLILKNLLKEEISIRNLANILEIVLENLSATTNPNILTEYIRIANKAYITEKLKDKDDNINVLALDPSLEKLIFDKVDEKNNTLMINPGEALEILKGIDEKLKTMESLGIKAAILTSPYLRRFVRKIIENTFPYVTVVSYSEIMPMSKVKTVAAIKV